MTRYETSTHEFVWILRRREMAKPLHGLEICPLDLLGGCVAHLGRRAPVILARQEVYRALLDVDRGDPVPRVEASKVEVEVAVEDTVGLAGIHVLDVERYGQCIWRVDADIKVELTQISCLLTSGLCGAIMP